MLPRAPLLLAALALGCTRTMTGLPDDPTQDPLVPDVPMYPFPSDFYLAADPSSATGRVVHFPAAVLPEGLTADTWAGVDGFSRIPAIVAWLPGGFDPSALPVAPGETVGADSPVWLLRESTWDKVPVLAEVDHQTANPSRQALILRPLVALDPDAGYVVVLRNGLVRADGSAHTAPPAFVALRDGTPTDSATVEGMRDDFALVLDGLDATGVDPDSVLLAWSFHTRSAEQLQTPMRALHEAMATASLDDWQIGTDQVAGDRREIRGVVTLPEFLGADGLVLDGDGVPVQQGTTRVPFLLTIPDDVDTTRPVIAFGHGFFSSKDETTWGSMDDCLHTWKMSAASIDFVGFDEPSAGETSAAIVGDLGALRLVVEQQLENQARFTALARLVQEDLAPSITEDRGSGPFHPLLDHDVRYLGISNGGSQGFGILAGSPVLRQGVLVVPGSGWSHMLQRAVNWNTLGFLLESRYDDPLELQLVLSMMQLTFDPVDGMSFPERLVRDPFPGLAPLKVELQEAVGDAQVNNLVTNWMARSAGVPLVTPSPLAVWGLDTVQVPPPGRTDVDASLFVYDEGYDPLPEGNVPPPEDNGAHESVRRLAAYKAQVGAFLEDQTVVQVCDGACDPD